MDAKPKRKRIKFVAKKIFSIKVNDGNEQSSTSDDGRPNGESTPIRAKMDDNVRHRR